jgi:plasmid stabilization system protein ParE
MPSRLTVQPEAEQDTDAAAAWYEARRTGLGDRFLNAVRAAMARIQRSPKVGRVVIGRYRRGVIPDWPYIIIYDYDEPNDTVIVYAVFHTSQDPAKWQQRLP